MGLSILNYPLLIFGLLMWFGLFAFLWIQTNVLCRSICYTSLYFIYFCFYFGTHSIMVKFNCSEAVKPLLIEGILLFEPIQGVYICFKPYRTISYPNHSGSFFLIWILKMLGPSCCNLIEIVPLYMFWVAILNCKIATRGYPLHVLLHYWIWGFTRFSIKISCLLGLLFGFIHRRR